MNQAQQEEQEAPELEMDVNVILQRIEQEIGSQSSWYAMYIAVLRYVKRHGLVVPRDENARDFIDAHHMIGTSMRTATTKREEARKELIERIRSGDPTPRAKEFPIDDAITRTDGHRICPDCVDHPPGKTAKVLDCKSTFHEKDGHTISQCMCYSEVHGIREGDGFA